MAVKNKLTFTSDFSNFSYNINIAAQFLLSDFATATEIEKISWKINSFWGDKDKTGSAKYIDFFLRAFHLLNRNDAVLSSIDLPSGPISGFGVDAFGVQSFGTERVGYTVSKDFQDRNNRFWILSWNILP